MSGPSATTMTDSLDLGSDDVGTGNLGSIGVGYYLDDVGDNGINGDL